jgi:hypothetical protein
MKKLPGAFWASVAAILYGGLLVVLAFTLPVYSTIDGSGVEGSSTLMDENGLGALVLIPLLIAGGVFWLLHVVCHHGSRVALAAAWTLTILTALLVIAGAMTVGLFFAPLAYLLIYACAATPRGRSLPA